MTDMYHREYTPERISELKPNEIFVFGSNLAGSHGGGAARLAYNRFGAVWGQGVGLQGQSYAIPTMQGGVETIKPYVDEFINFAKAHTEYKFLVTRIGCGIAAFTPEEIAPLFKEAIGLDNVILPKDFVKVLLQQAHLTEEEQQALMMWTMGTGNSAKCFNGENPIPPQKEMATKDSWKTLPMPDKNSVIPLNITIPSVAMDIIKYGHIPEAMEDHWFMYCDDTTIRYYRSWTGTCIFEAQYESCVDGYRITCLRANRDPDQYKNTNDKKDASLFMALLTEECGGDASEYWSKVF